MSTNAVDSFENLHVAKNIFTYRQGHLWRRGVNSGSKTIQIPMKNLSDHAASPCELLTSLLTREIQMGEISKLGWLIGLVKRATSADSLLFHIPAVTFNFQNPSFIPAYPITFFIGMLG
jgi:hypothetical protein